VSREVLVPRSSKRAFGAVQSMALTFSADYVLATRGTATITSHRMPEATVRTFLALSNTFGLVCDVISFGFSCSHELSSNNLQPRELLNGFGNLGSFTV
jgi:hypothetical protein